MKLILWLATLAFLPGLCISGVCSSPARADSGKGQTAETRVRTNLAGPAIQKLAPKGHADFRTAGTQRQLNVEVEKVNLVDGTVLTVQVNGVSIGMLTLKLGRGEVERNTKNGAVVPVVKKGDVVTVLTAAGTVVESGSF